MPNERLCELCRKLLCGDYQKGKYGGFIHHPDADSFRQAVQLPCPICSRAWALFNLQHSNYQQHPAIEKTGWLLHGPDTRHNTRQLVIVLCSGADYHYARFAFASCTDMSVYGDPIYLSTNTGSESATKFLQAKYKECLEAHPHCGMRDSKDRFYPSRLIDVGAMNDERVHLRESITFGDEGPYFCLSHCWGDVQPYKLTMATASTLKTGLPVSLLPKTFQDAITITRKFQVRFLWIDSLCIYQDSIDDWATEASLMKDVYSQAACTIAATAAKGSDEGLFYDRNPEHLQPFRLQATWTPSNEGNLSERPNYPPPGDFWVDHLKSWDNYVEMAPLNQRAWVAQERQLSPRIMHFGATQLFWECHAMKASEVYPSRLPKWAEPAWTRDVSALKSKLHRLSREQHHRPSANCKGKACIDCISLLQSPKVRDLYSAWEAFRITYSGCNLTKESDKLVALSGIAKDFGEVTGDQLVAGLWRNHLIEELCWFVDPLPLDAPPARLSSWRAPSWSWASNDQRIWASRTTGLHRNCSQREFCVGLEDLHVETRTSGQVVKASLRLKCKIIQATMHYVNAWSIEVYFSLNNVVLKDDPRRRFAYFDNDPTPNVIMRIYMIIVQRCADSDTEYCVKGLMVVPVSKAEQTSGKFNLDYHPALKRALPVDDSGATILPPDTLNLMHTDEVANEEELQDSTFKRIGSFHVGEGEKETVAKIIKEHESAEERSITLI